MIAAKFNALILTHAVLCCLFMAWCITTVTVGQKAISGQNTAVKAGSFLYGIRNYGKMMGFKICFSYFMEL